MDLPGPGSYNASISIFKEPNYKVNTYFGKSLRSQSVQQNEKNMKNGPGAYDIQSTLTQFKHKDNTFFTISKRRPLDYVTNTPGPGRYQIQQNNLSHGIKFEKSIRTSSLQDNDSQTIENVCQRCQSNDQKQDLQKQNCYFISKDIKEYVENPRFLNQTLQTRMNEQQDEDQEKDVINGVFRFYIKREDLLKNNGIKIGTTKRMVQKYEDFPGPGYYANIKTEPEDLRAKTAQLKQRRHITQNYHCRPNTVNTNQNESTLITQIDLQSQNDVNLQKRSQFQEIIKNRAELLRQKLQKQLEKERLLKSQKVKIETSESLFYKLDSILNQNPIRHNKKVKINYLKQNAIISKKEIKINKKIIEHSSQFRETKVYSNDPFAITNQELLITPGPGMYNQKQQNEQSRSISKGKRQDLLVIKGQLKTPSCNKYDVRQDLIPQKIERPKIDLRLFSIVKMQKMKKDLEKQQNQKLKEKDQNLYQSSNDNTTQF